MIRVEDLRVARGGKLLLDGITFSLGQGEVVALLGPNGAGKSTLMKTLLGLTRPTLGSIALNGRAIESYRPRERAEILAYVAQQQELVWDLSVSDIVSLGAQTPDLATATIAELSLGSFASRRIKSLSGGEQARVMLARALAAQTPFLFADEPAANLDIRHQRQIMRTLRHRARTRGLGVLVVLHDLNLAFAFADRVLLVQSGRLLLDATAAEAAQSRELDRAFGETFIRTTIDGQAVVFPTGETAC